MLDNVRGSELQIKRELRGVCAKGKRANTHLQTVTDNTQIGQMSEDTKGNPVPWGGRDTAVGERKTLEMGYRVGREA